MTLSCSANSIHTMRDGFQMKHSYARLGTGAVLSLIFVLMSGCGGTSASGLATQADPISQPSQDDIAPQVLIRTTLGDIQVELNDELAPNTVANFLEYVDSGHYDGTVFHRVISGFMIQGGGYNSSLERKETRDPIRNEADNGLTNNAYTIAMARTSEPHSATAQFFINVVDNPFLNYTAPTREGWGYTVFGNVVAGTEVVDQIAQVRTGSLGPFLADVPLAQMEILSVSRNIQ